MEQNLHKERYCRRLGHPVPFSYCRTTVAASPCTGILGCWADDPDLAVAAREAATGINPGVGKDKRIQLYDLIRRAAEA